MASKLKCPEQSPVFCEKNTISRGLCVPKEEDCHIRSNSFRNIPILEVNPLSARYGYKDSPELGRHCYDSNRTIEYNYINEYEDADVIPPEFSCLTYNVWGIARDERYRKLFNLRLPLLEKTINDLDGDILCLQEISRFAFDKLQSVINKYKFVSEIFYDDVIHQERKRSVDVLVLSKYNPSSVHTFGLRGVLGYTNALIAIKYPNLLVFNLHNQAGSKSSPGQQDKWLHYSRCRYDILESIRDLIDSNFADMKNEQIIICGDFNFNLDGSLDDWPEVEMLNQLKSDGFIDTYRYVNSDPGYTEDTKLNKMRWNQKLIEKIYRYDAVLYRGPLQVRSSELVGLLEGCLSKRQSQWFIDNLSDAKGGREGELERGEDNCIVINPSDHFGVLTKFFRRARPKRTRNNRNRNNRTRKHNNGYNSGYNANNEK
jgi:exonuclease III